MGVSDDEQAGSGGKPPSSGKQPDSNAGERRYRQLFTEMVSGMAVLEAIYDAAGQPVDFRVGEVNPTFLELTQARAEDVVGRAVSSLHGLDREWIERLTQVVLTGESQDHLGFRTRQDRRFVVRLFRSAQGEVAAMLSDVTDQARAHEALRERTTFVETIIASAGEGLIVYDRDLRFVVWNPVMEELTGLQAADVLGRSAPEVFPQIMAAGVHENLDRALAGESPTSREFQFTVPQTGRSGWVLGTYRPHRNSAGEVIGIVASIRNVTARHQAEEALHRSEEEFRSIFDCVGDGISIIDPDGRFIEVNRAYCESLGYARNELLRKGIADVSTPESAALARQRAAAIMAGGEFVFETTHIRRDRTRLVAEVAARRIEFRGQPAILSVLRDVSERKRVEDAAREQARFLQQLVDAIPIPMDAKDQAGRITLCNAAFADKLGILPSEAIGKTPAELGMPEAMLHKSRDLDVWRRGLVETYDASMPETDGTESRVVYTKAPIRAEDGTMTGIVAAALDITERYEAEQALRQSEERFRTLFEHAGDAIFIHHPDGRFIEANRAACERLGYTRDELLQMSPQQIDAPEYAALFRERVAELMAHGSCSFETAHVSRDGAVIPIELSSSIIDLGGQPAVLSIGRDISDRKRAEAERAVLEEQLRQAQKMEGIGQLAGGIAHDFNNLLTAIRGNATLALGELGPDSPARDDLEQIEQAADRAASLTRQLLAFARRTVLQPELIELGAVVRDVEPMLKRVLGEDVSLVTVTPPARGLVLADPRQIEQVIINLAVNARDAMPDGGTLTIETADVELDEEFARQHRSATPGPNSMLAVSDTGVGMDEATFGHLFEPFFTTKGPGKGTGLGLATVYGIVRQSGGAIMASSEPGRGSTFTVHLPRAAEAPTPAQTTPAKSERTRRVRRPATILVVEDDGGVRSFVTRVLEQAGYRVLAASGGAQAFESGRNERIDLLLTDVVMPTMNGPDVAARLTATHPKIRVLYVSGHPENAIVRHGVLEPGIHFLGKPFTAASLLAAVDDALTARPGRGRPKEPGVKPPRSRSRS